jgi:hypothetical protein
LQCWRADGRYAFGSVDESKPIDFSVKKGATILVHEERRQMSVKKKNYDDFNLFLYMQTSTSSRKV